MNNSNSPLSHRHLKNLSFWLIALTIGGFVGFATVGFRLSIAALQSVFYGATDPTLHTAARDLPWLVVLILPIIAGLIIGLIVKYFIPEGRVQSIATVIEGAALNKGRIAGRSGLASVAASLITLSMGGSTGREGPAVHLGALVSSKIARFINANGITGRNLLGCAVAAAVSASFNAPIAGALFALEVVLRHFAIHAFAPITLSAVAATVVSRVMLGDVTEFILPLRNDYFYTELPFFILLGLFCGLVAVGFMRSVFIAEKMGDWVQKRARIPRVLRPACAGVLLGIIAIWFPHIIGVGYETTTAALTGRLAFQTVMVFALVKVIAVAITIAGGMGGGIFSPSLMLGALVGLGFGLMSGVFLPTMQGDETLYALAGMGAVAAAVLGAPISTSLIIIEITGDWQAGLAVLIAVSISSLVAGVFVQRSFFLTQLARRGVYLAEGPQRYLLAGLQVAGLMRLIDTVSVSRAQALARLAEDGVVVQPSQSADAVIHLFNQHKCKAIGVMDEAGVMIGALYHVDVLSAYSAALADLVKEEHG